MIWKVQSLMTDAISNAAAKSRPVTLRLFMALLAFMLVIFAAGAFVGISGAMPGLEEDEDAQETLDRVLTEAGGITVIPTAPEGYAAVQVMQIILWEDSEAERTTATLRGTVDPYTPLPAKVRFYFQSDYVLGDMQQVDFDTGEIIGPANYEAAPDENLDFTNLTAYTVELTEGTVFSAGFSLDALLFAEDAQMGDSPLASFNFVPPNDLYGLIVGFVSPSPDRVGAGGQEDVVLIGETEEGEVYGIVRENVPGGEVQDYLVAFGSREARDAALAEAAAAAAASEEPTPTAMSRAADWATSPLGLVLIGASVVLIASVAVIVVLALRKRGADWDDSLDVDGTDDGVYPADDAWGDDTSNDRLGSSVEGKS